MSRQQARTSIRGTGSRVRKSAVALVAATLFAAVAGCGGGGADKPPAAAGTSRPTEMTDVGVAASAIAGVANLFLAQESDLFKAENLNVKPNFVKFTPDIVAAVVGGSDAFGHINTATLLQALEANVPIQIVSPGYVGEAAESGIYVAKGSDIMSIRDLEGKRIGVAGLKNIQQIAIMATAGEAGADPTKFEFVEIAVPTMVTAVERGQVDAVALPEPFVTLAGGQLTEVVDDMYEGFGSHPLITYYITSDRYAADHPEVVRAFGNAMVKAQDLAQQNPDRVRKSVAGYTEIPEDVVGRMALPSWTTNLQPATLERQAEFLVKYGFLKQMPADLDKLFTSAQGQQ